jgi:hypothetical protein
VIPIGPVTAKANLYVHVLAISVCLFFFAKKKINDLFVMVPFWGLFVHLLLKKKKVTKKEISLV